jgi:hypothetical protein
VADSLLKLASPTVNAQTLRQAREEFSHLLSFPNTKEVVWQKFFAEHPYVLSTALPIKLLPEDIVPLGRPGRSEPDLIFYPHKQPPRHPSYGVIELKRPDHRMLTQPRTNVVTLSATATAALAQGQQYLADLEQGSLLKLDERVLFVGTSAYVFIIMGLSGELQKVLVNAVLGRAFRSLLPPNFRILPYDYLYKAFVANVPPLIMSAVPSATIASRDFEAFLLAYAPDSAFPHGQRSKTTVGMLAALCPPDKLISFSDEEVLAKIADIHFDYKPSTPYDDDTHWGAYSPFDGLYYAFAGGLGGGFPRSPYHVGSRPSIFDED